MDFGNKLYDYFSQLHFDLMKPEIRARFDQYSKTEDFQGNMKDWVTRHVGNMLPDLEGGAVGAVTNAYQLTDDEWGKLYDALQETFQGMYEEGKPSYGGKSAYNSATNKFIGEWYDKTATTPFIKIFAPKAASSVAEPVFQNLANFLETNIGLLKVPFVTHLSSIFPEDKSYKEFIKAIRDKKYNSDANFASKLEQLIGTIQYYQINNDPDILPTATRTPPILMDFSTLPTDSKDWYEVSEKNRRIDALKRNYNSIFIPVLKDSTIREKFLGKAPSNIGKPLTAAIASTDYENKDSKDYLPPKYPDEKNWRQQFEDWKNETYENHFRRFSDPARGTRLFKDPWTQNIMKAFDKEKIKPTDGLEGILAKKDAILKRLQSSSNTTARFKWFADTIEKLKSSDMGSAIEGALRDGGQLQQVASAIIAEAVEQGKEKEAETALEILSVAKYGLMSSRTMDALGKTDVNLFSDKDLSWNKNSGIKMVTGALDKTIKFGLMTGGYAVTALHNLIQHRRTKIGNDISDNEILKKARGQWNEEDLLKNATKNLKDAEKTLDDLAHGRGKSGRNISDDATYNHAKNTVLPTLTGDDKTKLEQDIKAYENAVLTKQSATIEKTNIEGRQATRKRDIEAGRLVDPYQRLIKYWDDLETYSKTHAFSLGSMAVKRKAYLANEKANRDAEFAEFVRRNGALRAA